LHSCLQIGFDNTRLPFIVVLIQPGGQGKPVNNIFGASIVIFVLCKPVENGLHLAGNPAGILGTPVFQGCIVRHVVSGKKILPGP
jgi:hypothetical protein